MSRIENLFRSNEKAFVGYLTAGHKGIDASLGYSLAMIDGGVNILEIGFPFSDPIADGPVIQKAMQDALERNTSGKDVFALIREIRRRNNHVPIVLFTYLNPVMKAGEAFYSEASKAGADALLIVDLPMEESRSIHKLCKGNGLELIFIISPSTSVKRIKKISGLAGGFLYYVCRKGTTGMKSELPEGFDDKIKEIKSSSSMPVVAGFGISSRSMAEEVLKYADGFVVGSFFVSHIEKGCTGKELSDMAKNLKP